MAVKKLGLPRPAVGTQITDQYGRVSTVVGVVEDFHFTSLHQEIKPFVFGFTPNANTLAIKLTGSNIQESISEVQSTWENFVIDTPMDFYFLDDAIDKQYRSEQIFQTVFSIFTSLAMLIACLGLFALAAFTAQQRTKEIGIRKILGATVTGLMALLSKEYLVLVVLANLLAWPLAYITTNHWLENYAYTVTIDWRIFLLAQLLALIMVLFTVGFHTYTAANSSPVSALRDE